MKKMNFPQIAVTLYNLRDFCKTEEDLAKTLGLLAKIGYKAIQVSGVALDPAIIRKHLDENGMICCASHDSLDDMMLNTNKLIEKMQILGCPFTALGSAPNLYRSHLGMKELGRQMTVIGKKLAKHNIKLGYHNHHFEFNRLGEKQTLFQTFLDAVDPKYVLSELDVHWVTRGGGNPAAYIRKLAGRIDVIHFKDFTIIKEQTEDIPVFCEIGEGNLDWPDILQACAETGVRTSSIEQDKPFPGRNIFDSMKISFENLKAMGAKP